MNLILSSLYVCLWLGFHFVLRGFLGRHGPFHTYAYSFQKCLWHIEHEARTGFLEDHYPNWHVGTSALKKRSLFISSCLITLCSCNGIRVEKISVCEITVLRKAKLLSLSHRPSRAFISIWIVYVIIVGFFPQPFQMAACWSLFFKGSGFVGAQSVVWQLTECEGRADCTYYKTYWSVFQRNSWTRCFYEWCEQKGDAVTSMHICFLPMEVLPCLAWFPFVWCATGIFLLN